MWVGINVRKHSDVEQCCVPLPEHALFPLSALLCAGLPSGARTGKL